MIETFTASKDVSSRPLPTPSLGSELRLDELGCRVDCSLETCAMFRDDAQSAGFEL
jgi:hypothetical protein